MISLEQMLEDYRNGKREFPSYEELVKVSAHIKLIEKQLNCLLRIVNFKLKWPRNNKEQSC